MKARKRERTHRDVKEPDNRTIRKIIRDGFGCDRDLYFTVLKDFENRFSYISRVHRSLYRRKRKAATSREASRASGVAIYVRDDLINAVQTRTLETSDGDVDYGDVCGKMASPFALYTAHQTHPKPASNVSCERTVSFTTDDHATPMNVVGDFNVDIAKPQNQ
ncbi:hypothetical protein HPB48_003652 [Haemaphysalis longicornis]|uniref:Uncharacterized protein n=1 Tax=Haemaphysalis longicornis TaxID=44386 RepID=A0A9J6FG08_HAELO|nr:hypothetical protein HPB48_003652 [Haemaphysalis longicornis]